MVRLVLVLKRHRDSGAGLAGRAPTHRIDDHHHDAGALHRVVYLSGRPTLTNSKIDQFTTHRGHEVLWIGHSILLLLSILHGVFAARDFDRHHHARGARDDR